MSDQSVAYSLAGSGAVKQHTTPEQQYYRSHEGRPGHTSEGETHTQTAAPAKFRPLVRTIAPHSGSRSPRMNCRIRHIHGSDLATGSNRNFTSRAPAKAVMAARQSARWRELS